MREEIRCVCKWGVWSAHFHLWDRLSKHPKATESQPRAVQHHLQLGFGNGKQQTPLKKPGLWIPCIPHHSSAEPFQFQEWCGHFWYSRSIPWRESLPWFVVRYAAWPEICAAGFRARQVHSSFVIVLSCSGERNLCEDTEPFQSKHPCSYFTDFLGYIGVSSDFSQIWDINCTSITAPGSEPW